MPGTLTPEEEAQLLTTVEMFEVIVQSQPNDYQSWEILKEAYSKLGREKDAINASKKIAEAYLQLGQLSSAILEYETILQRYPDDPDVKKALAEIESRATLRIPQMAPIQQVAQTEKPKPGVIEEKLPQPSPDIIDDGREAMYKIFVEGKVIYPGDFELCWQRPPLNEFPGRVIDPFVQVLADKNIVPIEKSLRILCEKTHLCYLPLEKYDVDLDVARSFPRDTCLRWCVLPFDKMSRVIMVATTNPFNQQALRELSAVTNNRILWYIAPPGDITKHLRKIYRV